MATSAALSTAKLFSSFISTTITRRGFAAQGLLSRPAANTNTNRTGEKEKLSQVSWVPDPITGCYKPENQLDGDVDVDAAELRSVLLNHKN